MLALGASIAAATQIFVPRFIININRRHFPVSHIHDHAKFRHFDMLSIDAFFALAYVRNFLKLNFIFLAIRMVMEHKMIALLKTTFSLEIYFNDYANCVHLISNCRAGVNLCTLTLQNQLAGVVYCIFVAWPWPTRLYTFIHAILTHSQVIIIGVILFAYWYNVAIKNKPIKTNQIGLKKIAPNLTLQ